MSNVVIALIFTLLLAGCATAPSMAIATVGDPERGARLFTQDQENAPPCSTCHHTVTSKYGFSIGPNLAGVVERTGKRIIGMTTAEYLRQSILEPHRYVVSGYRNIMYPDYSRHLTEQNIQDLIAYLNTL